MYLPDRTKELAGVRLGKNVIIYGKTRIGCDTYVGDGCILGAPSVRSLNENAEGNGCRVGKNCTLRQYNVIYEDVEIGDNAQTSAFAHVRENSVIGEYSSLSTHVCVEAGAEIGSRVRVALHAAVGRGCIMQNDSFLGGGSMLAWDKKMDGTFAKIIVERGARISDNVTVIGGVRIGMGSIIGANSIVTQDIPAWSVAYGTPAKVKRKITEEEVTIFNNILQEKYGKTKPSIFELYLESV